jgi:hypothetical protein
MWKTVGGTNTDFLKRLLALREPMNCVVDPTKRPTQLIVQNCQIRSASDKSCFRAGAHAVSEINSSFKAGNAVM